MDSLTTPKFKSKVEQFYYDHRAVSELDLASQEVFSGSESPQHGQEQRNITEARNRAYSGDGRKSYFTFENGDSRNSEIEKHGSRPGYPSLGQITKQLLYYTNIYILFSSIYILV